jgi:hypothetical protein
MRQTEHVLYITLIDFLLQLLFLGMVISVIYAIAQSDEKAKLDPAMAKDALESMQRVKTLTGISDITTLTDELTRMGPLQTAAKHAELGREMEKDVLGAGGRDAAKKALAEYAARRGGQGKPSCLPDGGRLASLHAYSDRIELHQPMSKEMANLLSRIGLPQDRSARLSLAEFRDAFAPVTRLHPECRFNVEIVEHSYDTRPRDAIRSAFAAMWTKPAPDRR